MQLVSSNQIEISVLTKSIHDLGIYNITLTGLINKSYPQHLYRYNFTNFIVHIQVPEITPCITSNSTYEFFLTSTNNFLFNAEFTSNQSEVSLTYDLSYSNSSLNPVDNSIMIIDSSNNLMMTNPG